MRATKPVKRPTRRAVNPVKYGSIGGWDVKRKTPPRGLYQVTIFTSIDSWSEYVVARDLAGVKALLEVLYPEGWVPGYEPEIIRLDSMPDSIYLCD